MNRNVVPIENATHYVDVRASAQEEVSVKAQEGAEYNSKQPVKITRRRHKTWHTDEILRMYVLKTGSFYSYKKIGEELGRTEYAVTSMFHKIHRKGNTEEWEHKAKIERNRLPTLEERQQHSDETLPASEPDIIALMDNMEDLLLDVATKMEVIRERIKPYITIAEQLRKL